MEVWHGNRWPWPLKRSPWKPWRAYSTAFLEEVRVLTCVTARSFWSWGCRCSGLRCWTLIRVIATFCLLYRHCHPWVVPFSLYVTQESILLKISKSSAEVTFVASHFDAPILNFWGFLFMYRKERLGEGGSEPIHVKLIVRERGICCCINDAVFVFTEGLPGPSQGGRLLQLQVRKNGLGCHDESGNLFQETVSPWPDVYSSLFNGDVSVITEQWWLAKANYNCGEQYGAEFLFPTLWFSRSLGRFFFCLLFSGR